MSDDYARGRCCAIRDDNGRRCNGRWATAVPCSFAWDPVNGVGIDGPWAVFCYRHRRRVYRLKETNARVRVFRGWLGPANKYGYGTCVFRDRKSWRAAAWWWARRKDSQFGQSHRRDAA